MSSVSPLCGMTAVRPLRGRLTARPLWWHADCKTRMLNASWLAVAEPGAPFSVSCQLRWLMLDMQAHSVDMRRALNASGLAVAMPGTHFSGSGQPSWLHASTCKRIQ